MKNLITIELPNKVKVKALGNREVEIEKIEIFELIDSPLKKEVWAKCMNHPTKILLWKDESYDAIGQWTESDVINKVLEIYS